MFSNSIVQLELNWDRERSVFFATGQQWTNSSFQTDHWSEVKPRKFINFHQDSMNFIKLCQILSISLSRYKQSIETKKTSFTNFVQFGMLFEFVDR